MVVGQSHYQLVKNIAEDVKIFCQLYGMQLRATPNDTKIQSKYEERKTTTTITKTDGVLTNK
jgi:hypothetical protein